MLATAGDGGVSFPCISLSLPLPPLLSSPPSVLLSLLASSVFCQCCVMPLLSSSVFQLHRSAAGLLRECVWGREEAGREYMFLPVCVCLRTRICVHAHVCISLAVLCCHGNVRHMAQAALWPSAARVGLQEASFSQ